MNDRLLLPSAMASFGIPPSLLCLIAPRWPLTSKRRFMVRKSGTGVPPVDQAQRQSGTGVPPAGKIVGTTRFYDIVTADRKVAIGYTWLAKSAQRTPVNTEAKLLLLTHAFDNWGCVRVELITDVLNQQSRAAILRLGAKQEGILRNHMILPSGRIRDSVCFSIIDSEWPDVKARLAAKLDSAFASLRLGVK